MDKSGASPKIELLGGLDPQFGYVYAYVYTIW